jgi:uncharacterized protein (DUF2249 family)
MEKLNLEGATVEFSKDIVDGVTIYSFDTSMCEPPHPMVNAMIGLQLLDDTSKLVMINHKSPAGLFPKIESEFNFTQENTNDGKVKVIFTKKSISSDITDFSDNCCMG